MQTPDLGPAISKANIIAYGRSISTSVDALVAFDLSTHLFRAFSCKHDQSRSRPLRKSLTTWPLPPKIVPQESNGDAWTSLPEVSSYISKPVRPTRELQELLVAEILRISKASLERHLQSSPCSPSQASMTGGEVVQDQAESMNLDDEDEHEASQDNLNPAILADDDAAAQILHLSTHQFVRKLDALLMSLYLLRKAALRPEAPRETTSNRRDSSSHNRVTKNGGKCLRQKKLHRTPSRNSVCDIDESAAGAQGNVNTQGPQEKTRLRTGHPALITWSDVTVTASMCPFDADTLARAHARCSSLLSSSKAVQSFRDEYRTFDASQLRSLGNDRWITDDGEVNDKVHADGFLQPIEGQLPWKSWKGAS